MAPEVVFVDVFALTGSWACPFSLDVLVSLAGKSFSRRHRPIAYVVENGFRLFIPVEDGWLKRSLNVERLDDDNPLLRLHDAVCLNGGPVPAPPESKPRLPSSFEEPEADEPLLLLFGDRWGTVVVNTRPLVGLDASGEPLRIGDGRTTHSAGLVPTQ